MSISTVKDVFCDLCSQWETGCVNGTDAEARRALKREGWIRRRSNVTGEMEDICPSCSDGPI